MSYSYQEGKDIVHFITEEDLKEYTDREEKEEQKQKEDVNDEVHEQYPGAVNEKGEINWDCPCLGGLGTEGPCVEDFRSAFSCWMFSSADEGEGKEKGDECVDNFFKMSMCMQQNEEFYDDLNARNKASADEAREKYESEEREALAAAETEQKVQEAIAASEHETESESSEHETETESSSVIAADDCPLTTLEKAEPAVITSSEETNMMTSSIDDVTSSSADITSSSEETTSHVTWVLSEPQKDDTTGNLSSSTVIVAAKTEEEENSEEVEGDEKNE